MPRSRDRLLAVAVSSVLAATLAACGGGSDGGESSGELDSMLDRASQSQERELDGLLAALVGLLGPLLIVLMGIMLDRTTSAASERSEIVARGGGEDLRKRRLVLAGLLVPVAVAVWYSRYALDAAMQKLVRIATVSRATPSSYASLGLTVC